MSEKTLFVGLNNSFLVNKSSWHMMIEDVVYQKPTSGLPFLIYVLEKN